MKNLSIFFFFLFSIALNAQTLNPVRWEYSFEKTGKDEGIIVLKAKLQEKWHIYSQNQSGDGPIPTSFVFNPDPHYKLIDKVQEPACEKVFSEVFESEVQMFSHEVSFQQKISFTSKTNFLVQGELEYMSCNDVSCLPPRTEKFSIPVKIE